MVVASAINIILVFPVLSVHGAVGLAAHTVGVQLFLSIMQLAILSNAGRKISEAG